MSLYKMALPGEKEVFRITPTMGKCYEWTESTRSSGGYPNERRFAPEQNVIYVGELINIAQGGFEDGSWRTDTFINRETGNQTQVPYSYEGRTCFIEVSCRNLSDQMGVRWLQVESNELKMLEKIKEQKEEKQKDKETKRNTN